MPYCGANPIADMWSEKVADACSPARSARAVRDGDDAEAREQMALAATFAGLGFGNAGVHIPHANAYPIAGRVRDFRPDGLPAGRADGAARDGGLADRAGGVPVHLRGRTRSGTCARRGCSTPTAAGPTAPDALPDGAAPPDARHRHPQRARRRSATTRPTSTTSSTGAMKQQRLLATAPREVTADDLAAVFRASLEHW